MSSIDLAYSMMYSVLVKLVYLSHFTDFWPELSSDFYGHTLYNGRVCNILRCIYSCKLCLSVKDSHIGWAWNFWLVGLCLCKCAINRSIYVFLISTDFSCKVKGSL